MLIVSL